MHFTRNKSRIIKIKPRGVYKTWGIIGRACRPKKTMKLFIYMLYLLVLLCSSIPTLVVCQNSTGGYILVEVVGVGNSSVINASGLNVSQLGTNTNFNLVLLPKLSPGNTTKTDNSSSSGLDWWAWALIAGAGAVLIIMLILVAVFYADVKKMWGYQKVATQMDGKDKKVIEVALVQACGPYV